MKKEIAALILLAALFAGSLINTRYICSLADQVNKKVSEASGFAASGEWENAERAAREATDKWASSNHYTHVFIRHSEVDCATGLFYELLREIYSRSAGEAKAVSQLLAARLEEIAAMEKPTLGSIF